MPSEHSFLSPSASKRWMTCTPSAMAESKYPQAETVYALEGTLAHGIAEALLNYLKEHFKDTPGEQFTPEQACSLEDHQLSEIKTKCEKYGFDFVEMLTTVYENYVLIVFEDYLFARGSDPEAMLLIESKLELDTFIPGGFGSSDAVILHDDTIQVYDLKYGQGVKVDAGNNSQMMCYALGVIYGEAAFMDVNTVKMTIIQPRLQHVSTATRTYQSLIAWGYEVLKPAAELAIKGEGAYVAGQHCRFCRAAPRCRALMLSCETFETAFNQVEALSDEELSKVLSNLGTIKNWVSTVEDYALSYMLGGKKIPGFKVVEGVSRGKIQDQAKAISVLKDTGLDPETYMKAPELKSITDLKKILRPKAFDQLLGSLVIKPQGKPVIAGADDPKPEYSAADQDFKDL